MASLTVQAEGAEENFSLEVPSVTLGRGLESDIRLKDIKASRRHCQVVKSNEGFRLLDLGSGNGTYVNGILVDHEHPLRHGDKIQIGTTVILFVDGGPTAGAKAPTHSTPATDAEKKSASSPTGQIPATVTRPTVKGVPPQTAVTKRATPAASARPPTTAATTVKPLTTRAAGPSRVTTRRSTGSVPRATTRTTARVSMTERFAQEAGKKRINPLVLVGTGAGVVIVGVILALFVFGIGGGDNVKIDRDRIKVLTGDGAKLIKDGKYDEGIQKYRDALALCDKHPKELAQSKVAIKAEIDSAEKTRTERAAAETAWETLKKEYDDNKYDLKEFREKVRAMRDEHQYLQMPWAQGESQDPRENIKVMYEKVDHQYTEYLAQQGRQGFQAKRQEIIDQFHLNQKGGEDFAGAQRAWKKYRDEAKDSDAKNKAEAQIVDVNRRAYDSWNDLSRKIEGKERDEAVKLLEDTLPRFEGCSFNDVDIAQAIRGKIRTLKEG